MEFITKENITFVLALIGAIGTAVTIIGTIFRNSINVDMEIVWWMLSVDKNYTLVYVQFINKSYLPLSILSVNLLHDGKRTPCNRIGDIVGHYERTNSNGDLIHTEPYYAARFPIFLPSLAGSSGYFAFRLHEQKLKADAKYMTFEVGTSRNKTLKMTLELPPCNQNA